MNLKTCYIKLIQNKFKITLSDYDCYDFFNNIRIISVIFVNFLVSLSQIEPSSYYLDDMWKFFIVLFFTKKFCINKVLFLINVIKIFT